MTKIGRNENCPCGSGKKYKRCCGSPEKREEETSMSLPARVPPEEYETALELLTDYFDAFLKSDRESEALAGEAAWFDLLYEPGTASGVPESIFLLWLYLDVVFGESERTLCERFIDSPAFKDCSESLAEAVRRLSKSYPAFYRTDTMGSGFLYCRELGTGRKWQVTAGDEEELSLSVKGEVQYMRLAGPPDNACMVDSPWLLDDDMTDAARDLYEDRWAETRSASVDSADEEGAFRGFNKTLSAFWAGYINGQIEMPGDEEGFRLLNTEGQAIRFCEVVFRIGQKSAFLEKMSEGKDFEYDGENEQWAWVGEPEDEESSWAPSILADLSLRDDRLVGETNSEERALALRERLQEIVGDTVSFECINHSDVELLAPGNEEMLKSGKGKKRKK
jgi:hypothetical protein